MPTCPRRRAHEQRGGAGHARPGRAAGRTQADQCRLPGDQYAGTECGQLAFGANAVLRTDPGASVTLLAGQQLTVDGEIDAAGGDITLGLTPIPSEAPYSDRRSIWIGKNASLSAKGSADLLYTDARGITTGEVLDGGSIRIGRLEER